MVIVMLMMIFLAMLSIAFWAYSRTLLTSAAAQTARFAANVNISASVANIYAQNLMTSTIAGSAADSVRCDPIVIDGPMVGLTCSMHAPGLLPVLDGILPDINVTAHALNEGG